MKYILIAALSILSLTVFSKGGGGGHSSSSHSSASHSSHEAHSATEHTAVSEHTTMPYHSYPNGVYWILLLNHQTNTFDTIKGSSSQEIDDKINSTPDYDKEQFTLSVFLMLMVMIIAAFLMVVVAINKNK